MSNRTAPEESCRLDPEEVSAIFDALAEERPAPETELRYESPFELLVAVILSAQSTDKMVNRVTAELYEEANTPEAILALGREELADRISRIGLYNNKAKYIIRTCELLLENHDGEVPGTRRELQALPGVGRKTANVVLNVAFGEPTIAVDTHIHRLSNRLGLADTKRAGQTEKALLAVVPEEHRKNAHHYLILHGRYVCKARKPECGECVVHDWCLYPEKTTE